MKIMRGLFLVIFLTACQSSLIAELVTQSGQALYHDDFSNPANGWLQTVSTNGTLGYADGAYHMLVQSAGYDLRAVSGQTYGDVQIEADATRLAGPVSNRLGLICRFQDMDNYYFFIISSDGYYAIGKIKNGAASLLGQEMMAYSAAIVQGSAPNRLRFDCIGNTLTGTVNGQVIAITNDADFSGGDAGLITGAFDETGVEVSFDNFMVYKP
ncbi:MAG: hypothetical protein Q8N46_04700 [Anaerolineales bacterium]|nr:hypothetical protein [Anaerolineales bacterium]